MGNTAPEQMTPPAESVTSDVHWTLFPASSVPIRWDDHKAAHNQVMKLFPDDLSVDRKTSRANGGILYRIDNVNGHPHVLVQSKVAPVLLPAGARTRKVNLNTTLVEGQTVMLRLAVNPIARGRGEVVTGPDGTPAYRTLGSGQIIEKRSVTTSTVAPDDIPDWLANRLDPALRDVTIANHYRDTNKSGKHKVVVDTIDAIATVADPTELARLLAEGVGRAKSYGCGLLTVRPATHTSF